MILHGDTDSTPEGRGTYGSRTTAVGGSAVYNATQRLKEKMKQIASHMLEASVSDVTLEDGKFSVAGSPQKSVTFAEVAATANLSNTLAPKNRARPGDDCLLGARGEYLPLWYTCLRGRGR